MNTKIEYMYRDASNYKAFRNEVLEGVLTPKQITEIKQAAAPDGFIPSQVGLDNLQGELMSYDSGCGSDDYDPFGADGDDHVWHELDAIERTKEPVTLSMPAKVFYKQFMAAKKAGWNIAGAMESVMAHQQKYIAGAKRLVGKPIAK